MLCVYVCVFSDLVENKGLADVAPAGCGTEVVDQQQQQQHEGNTGRGIDGVDEEHHDNTSHNAEHAGVPGEVTEGGPVNRTVEVKVRIRKKNKIPLLSQSVMLSMVKYYC